MGKATRGGAKTKPALRVLAEMLPEEAEEHLSGGGDLAIIPIGSIEQHGPHLLTGCDGYITLAKALEVGRLTGGVVLPMIHYSWVGATNAFSAGIGVRESVFVDYLQAVVRAVRRAGFRRILVMNSHGGNFYSMRTFPQKCLREDGIVVMTVYGTAFSEEAERIARETGAGEAACLLGALRMLGREDLVGDIAEYTRKAVAEFGDRPHVERDPKSFRDCRALGVIGGDYFHETQHVQPDSRQTDPEAGVRVLRAVAEHIAGQLGWLGKHVEETEREQREPGSG